MSFKNKVLVFTAVAILSFVVLVVLSAMRQGWFAPEQSYKVSFTSADGLFPGAAVTLMGLKVGQVKAVEISNDNRIHVEIRIQKKYSEHITEDAAVRMARPFIIGEKEIMIVPSSKHSNPISPEKIIQGEESLEITDLLSGGRMGPYLETLGTLFGEIKKILDASQPGSASLSGIYLQAFKSLKSLEQVAYDLKKIRTEVIVTHDTKKLLKQLASSTENLKSMMDTGHEALPSLKQLSQEANNMMPHVNHTLSELSMTLQAMQRSFLLRGAVEDIREEQEKASRAQPTGRLPASIKSP